MPSCFFFLIYDIAISEYLRLSFSLYTYIKPSFSGFKWIFTLFLTPTPEPDPVMKIKHKIYSVMGEKINEVKVNDISLSQAHKYFYRAFAGTK